MIELQHLRKEYDGAVPLKDVSTVIHDGDIIAVIGPSGTGKGTLVERLLNKESPHCWAVSTCWKNPLRDRC